MTYVAHRLIRHAVLVVLVDAGRPLTVAEIGARLRAAGIEPSRQPASRAISDAMRTDIKAGRVARLGWGRYCAARPTAGHVRYARRRVREALRDGSGTDGPTMATVDRGSGVVRVGGDDRAEVVDHP